MCEYILNEHDSQSATVDTSKRCFIKDIQGPPACMTDELGTHRKTLTRIPTTLPTHMHTHIHATHTYTQTHTHAYSRKLTHTL